MKWKPMLLSNDEFDLHKLTYSAMFMSIKRDGIRAEVTCDGIVGRSLKKFRNLKLETFFEKFFSQLPPNAILEAEIYCHGVPCREMSGICSSMDKEIPAGTKLYIFGLVDFNQTFGQRYRRLQNMDLINESFPIVELVEQYKCESADEAQTFYFTAIAAGYEGVVLMDGNRLYKSGRVTINQHIGFKMKPEREDDLEIVGVTERMINTNESLVNELGQSYKRNTVDAKESTGIAACFTCKLPDGGICDVTITGSEADRRQIWQEKESYIGKYAVVKSMDYGTKDSLRHPRLISIKDSCEK